MDERIAAALQEYWTKQHAIVAADMPPPRKSGQHSPDLDPVVVAEGIAAMQAEQSALLARVEEIGEEAGDRAGALLVLLDRVEWHERYFVFQRLGQIGDERVLRALMTRLEQEPPPSPHRLLVGWKEGWQDRIGERLFRRFSRWYRQTQAETLQTERALDRAWTAGALGKIGDPRARTAIQRLLDDSNETVRKYARHALDSLPA